jgi:hypothetical protein
MLVGPDVSQPDPYRGYGGFVGWQSPIVLRDGTLLCLHGSYGAGGFRAMFSTDVGQTWECPDRKWGFPVDPSVYGYAQAVELADGTVWAAYIHTGVIRRRTRGPKPSGPSACGCDPTTTESTCCRHPGPVPDHRFGK